MINCLFNHSHKTIINSSFHLLTKNIIYSNFVYQQQQSKESKEKSRPIIIPQKFTIEPFDSFNLIKSNNYQFVTKNDFSRFTQIYQHKTNTSASLLRKDAIHIIQQSISQFSKRQKYQAFLKKFKERYDKSYDNKSPSQIFHLQRKIKYQILKKCQTIGFLSGKYKNYRQFKSFPKFLAQKTLEQYEKKGIQIKALDAKIFPKGQVWLPTNQNYIKMFLQQTKLNPIQNVTNILDLGCGSGIFSFILAKCYRKAKITGLDINQNAIQTCNINAATLKYENVKAYVFDINKSDELKHFQDQQKLDGKYDYIISNPPWIPASPIPGSNLSLGVYDQKSKMLKNSIKISGTRLKNKNSRMFLIYSDLSKILGLQSQSVQQLCYQNKLVIHSLKERPLVYNLQNKSPLNMYKQKSKMQLFQIGLIN